MEIGKKFPRVGYPHGFSCFPMKQKLSSTADSRYSKQSVLMALLHSQIMENIFMKSEIPLGFEVISFL